MSEQKHSIKRQIIEWTVASSAAAPAFQDEVSRIYHQRIVPLIDQCFSEISQPDRVYRIESLELDLGVIDSHQLEEQFFEKVNMALRDALIKQISLQEQETIQAGRSPKAQSALELFAYFVRTGSLPWWADETQPQILFENMQQLLHEAPQELRRLLQTLGRETSLRERIASQYSDEQLAQLCTLLVPAEEQSFKRDPHDLIATLLKTKTAASWPPSRVRQNVWANLLLVAAVGGQEYPSPAAFYRAVLERVAAELGREMLAEVQLVLQTSKASGARRFKGLLKGLEPAVEPASTGGELVQRLAQLQANRAGPLVAVLARLQALVPRFSEPLRAHWMAVLNTLPASARTASQNPAIQAAAGLINLLLNEEALQAELGPGEWAQLIKMAGTEKPETTEVYSEIDLNFSEADELAVANAGLVILWPFLTNFFTHLGLMEDKQFKDLSAQQRAAELLQVIATREAAPPEYRLPLNKLLCGLEPQQVFDFGPPLRKAEARECVKLLKAVIAQAPILHNMSVAGFTGSFLLRPGLLSLRDGHWLLRVERQTYDIVLERFPWSWQWVKLPWMESPLQVEW